jgi:hypothetical protein
VILQKYHRRAYLKIFHSGKIQRCQVKILAEKMASKQATAKRNITMGMPASKPETPLVL